MNIIINKIIKSNKITDYLSLRGINVHSHDGNRYKYRCPLPFHKTDRTPSFFVYDKGDRQDYICYGCKSSGSIIQFIAAYEQIAIRDAIKRLAEGLDISIDNVLDSLIKEIVSNLNNELPEDKNDNILATSLFISVHMHDFLKKVDFDSKELEIAEQVFAIMDGLISIESLDELEKLSDCLPKKTAQRYRMYLDRKRKEEILDLKGLKAYE